MDLTKILTIPALKFNYAGASFEVSLIMGTVFAIVAAIAYVVYKIKSINSARAIKIKYLKNEKINLENKNLELQNKTLELDMQAKTYCPPCRTHSRKEIDRSLSGVGYKCDACGFKEYYDEKVSSKGINVNPAVLSQF